MFKVVSLTLLAVLAFAGNSVLCRMALADNVIDAASFTVIRLFSGSIFLLLLVMAKTKHMPAIRNGSWFSAVCLYLYALAFSYAYISLDTGTGALILFGSVQVTMIAVAFIKGNTLSLVEWCGVIMAFLGLSVLLMPGASAPSVTGFLLMLLSGMAWGFYTLAGRGSEKPLIDTSNNFLRTLPFVAATLLLTFNGAQISHHGVILAIASGVVTSGLGYAIWYSVLPALKLTQAAIIQLAVPVVAAFGGVLFANELISNQLMLSSILVLGGVMIVTLNKPNNKPLDE